MIGHEEMYLQTGNFEKVAETRERTAPLVRSLVELSAQPGVGEFRPRVALLVGCSAAHSLVLMEKMQEVRDEIRRSDRALHHASRLAPAYVKSSEGPPRRFLATG